MGVGEIGSVERFSVRPGDVLVLRLAHGSTESVAGLLRGVTRVLPDGVLVLVLEPGADALRLPGGDAALVNEALLEYAWQAEEAQGHAEVVTRLRVIAAALVRDPSPGVVGEYTTRAPGD